MDFWNHIPPIIENFRESTDILKRGALSAHQYKIDLANVSDEYVPQTPEPIDFSLSNEKIQHLERLMDRHETYSAILYALDIDGLELDDHEYVMELAHRAFNNLGAAVSPEVKKQLSYALSSPQIDNDLSLHLVA